MVGVLDRGPTMANLVLAMFKSDGTRRDFPLSKDRVIIGRKVNCDLRIPLTSVSRQHCEITISDGKIQIKDLGSSNGTYHNSVRVQEADLAAGDELAIGPVVFTLVIDGKPENIKPVHTVVNSEGGERQQTATQNGGGASASASAIEAEDLDLPELLDDEGTTPTVDIDDDPIAALESLASGDINDESDEFDDIDFFDIDDDDDKL